MSNFEFARLHLREVEDAVYDLEKRFSRTSDCLGRSRVDEREISLEQELE